MLCPKCNEPNTENAVQCPHCGAALNVFSGSAPRMSTMAIWSVVLGILGFMTCIVPPFGIVGAILGKFPFRAFAGAKVA